MRLMPVTPRLLTPPCDGKLRKCEFVSKFHQHNPLTSSKYVYIQKNNYTITPRSLTARPRKMMVGRVVSFWDGLFSGEMLNRQGAFIRYNNSCSSLGAGDLETLSCSTMSTRTCPLPVSLLYITRSCGGNPWNKRSPPFVWGRGRM